MQKLKQLLLVVVMAVSVVGCATKREDVLPPSSFYSKPDSIMIIHKTDVKHPVFSQIFTRGGLLPAIIHEAACKSMAKEIEKMDCSDVLEKHYFQYFKQYFADKQFTVVVEREPLTSKEVPSVSSDDLLYAPYDFKFLKDKYNVNYALVLEINSLGITREYDGFISVDNPYADIKLKFYLVDLKSNKIIGEYNAIERHKALNNWDAPPAYPALNYALKKGYKTALVEGQEVFSGLANNATFTP